MTYSVIFLLAYQTLHEIDHILQYMQRFEFGIEGPPGLFEGVLNSSDASIHLWINAIEYTAFGLVWISLREGQLKGIIKTRAGLGRWPFKIFVSSVFFLFAFQTLHVIDHLLQFIQLYMYGIEGPPGLFQGLLNSSDTLVHLWLNGIVYSTIIVLWISFRESQAKKVINDYPLKWRARA